MEGRRGWPIRNTVLLINENPSSLLNPAFWSGGEKLRQNQRPGEDHPGGMFPLQPDGRSSPRAGLAGRVSRQNILGGPMLLLLHLSFPCGFSFSHHLRSAASMRSQWTNSHPGSLSEPPGIQIVFAENQV